MSKSETTLASFPSSSPKIHVVLLVTPKAVDVLRWSRDSSISFRPITDAATCCARAFESASYFISLRTVATLLYSLGASMQAVDFTRLLPPLSISLAASIKCVPLPPLHSGRAQRAGC